MPCVRDILEQKGRSLITVSPEATVFEAAVLMNEHRIGALVVTQEDQVVGIFTERDILQRVVAQQRDPNLTVVKEVMTIEVACCQMHTDIEEARSVMKNRRIRHLPVCGDENKLLGLISIGDLNAYDTNSQEQTIHLLHQYLYFGM